MIQIGCPSFGTDAGRSGIGSYLRELLFQFDKEQWKNQFTIELVGPAQDRDCYLEGTSNISWHQVEGADASPMQNFFWNQLNLPGLCRKRGYDLLFLPAANRRLTGRAPCPAVGTVHDLAALHIKEKYDFSHQVFNRKMLPRLIRGLDQIITVSSFSKNDILRFSRVEDERVTVVHLAADKNRFFPSDNREEAGKRIRKAYGITKPFILYISRLEHPGKNHVNLIHAFTRFREAGGPQMQLVLPGPDKERAEEIHKAASQSPVSRDIIFPGFIAHEDVPDFYRSAELFIMPSYFEGFGLPVLEAMACGTPVITSTAASLPEVSGPHTPHVDPDDIEGMKDAMMKVLNDPSARDELSRKGIQWASGFSWEKTAQATAEVFMKALGNRR